MKIDVVHTKISEERERVRWQHFLVVIEERGERATLFFILLVKEERWQFARWERGVKYFRLLVIINSKNNTHT
jgi:hypothetical protein